MQAIKLLRGQVEEPHAGLQFTNPPLRPLIRPPTKGNRMITNIKRLPEVLKMSADAIERLYKELDRNLRQKRQT
jgi:hypothetical protein